MCRHIATRLDARGQREQVARLFEVRHVEHLAVQPHGAQTRVLFEHRDHARGVGDLFIGWRERAVDHRRLVRMDRDLADETGAAVAQAIRRQARKVAIVDIDHAYRLRADRARGRQAQGLGQEVGVVVLPACRVAVVAGAQRRGEVFAAPGHRDKTLARRVEVGVKGQQRGSRLSGHAEYFCRAITQALARLERRQIVGQRGHVLRRIDLGQADAVGCPRHDRRQIRQRVFGVERIDAHPQLLARAVGARLQIRAGHLARDLLAVLGDRIFQVEYQGVGRVVPPFGELSFAVAGNEKPRANHACGRFIMRPVRTTYATSSSRWL